MRRLNLIEFQRTPAVPLTAGEMGALRRAVSDLTIEPALDNADRYDLTPGSCVGVVQAGNLEVEIRPKVGVERLLFLVSFALDARAWRDQQVSVGAEPDLLQAMIPGFLFQVNRALRGGLLQGYRTKEEALAIVRGRVRFEEQLRRHYGRFHPVEVRYDDYTVDTEVNRLIKAALHRLGVMRLRSTELRDQLRHAWSRFAQVVDVEYDAGDLPAITYDRLNGHYRPAVELAKFVLRSTSIELQEGSVTASAFLVNMNEVFEDFVLVALREALGVTAREFPQGARGRVLVLDEANHIQLKPDLSWWDGDHCLFVGDVKYKRLDIAGVVHSDLYQLLAYTISTGVPEGLLIYAAGESEPGRHVVRNAAKTLEVGILELEGTPDEILNRVARIASRIRDIASIGRTLAPSRACQLPSGSNLRSSRAC